MNSLTYSKAGLALTEHFEAAGEAVTAAYWDANGKVWTIGYGHTGPDVHEGLVWSQEQCETALAKDVLTASADVNKHCLVPLNQNQFDALVDFSFNCGIGNFNSSTLLKLLNKGLFVAADDEFAKWVRSGGHVLSGLVTRRAEEAHLFAEAC